MEKIDNADLSKYTTYKLDGAKKTIYFPSDVLELAYLTQDLKSKGIRYKILGNGSNMIISSKYDGVLIKLKKFDKLIIDGNIVKVGSGYMLPKLALKCAENNLSGLEFAFGIPATVGGAIYQNAGAYGFEVKDVLKEVTVLNSKGEVMTFSKADMAFSYRDSILKHLDLICLEATFELKKGNHDDVLARMNTNLESRKEKQPLEFPSAGSVFRNPEGASAGRLIEEAGLKGTKVGGAMVSLKHANFIVNVGGASDDDVIQLIKLIQKKVYDKFGILLKAEQEFLE